MKRRSSSVSVMLVSVVAVLVLAGALPALAAGPVPAEMQSAVVTEGLTAAQHVQLQGVVAARLLADLPGVRQMRRAQIPLTEAEIASLDQVDSSSTPLRIGLVKPVMPLVE